MCRQSVEWGRLAVKLGTLLTAFTLFGAGVSPAADAPYKVAAAEPQKKKFGATKNVAVDLYRADGTLHRRIVALEGAEFAVGEVSPGLGRPLMDLETRAAPLFVPEFSAGDKKITVRIDPKVGFTELLGLKILDPVVIAVGADGIIEADRPGVRAVGFKGKTTHSGCFLAVAQSTDGSFSIGGFFKAPETSDGSMARTPGEILDCEVQLTGQDTGEYVTQEAASQGLARFVFVSSKAK